VKPGTTDPTAALELAQPPPPTDRLSVVPLPAQNVLEASPVVTRPRDSLTRAANDAAQVASSSSPAAPSGREGGYQLQVSSFRTQAEADQFSTQLRARDTRRMSSKRTCRDAGRGFGEDRSVLEQHAARAIGRVSRVASTSCRSSSLPHRSDRNEEAIERSDRRKVRAWRPFDRCAKLRGVNARRDGSSGMAIVLLLAVLAPFVRELLRLHSSDARVREARSLGSLQTKATSRVRVRTATGNANAKRTRTRNK